MTFIDIKKYFVCVAPADFDAQTDILTFPPFTTNVTTPYLNVNDGINEEQENFTATLSLPSAGSISRATATVIITDDDGRQLYSLSQTKKFP